MVVPADLVDVAPVDRDTHLDGDLDAPLVGPDIAGGLFR